MNGGTACLRGSMTELILKIQQTWLNCFTTNFFHAGRSCPAKLSSSLTPSNVGRYSEAPLGVNVSPGTMQDPEE